MVHLVLLITSAVAIEIFFHLGFMSTLKSILEIWRKVHRVVLSRRISDHWKEVVIPQYSIALMQSCLRILMILILMLSSFLVGDLLYFGTIHHAVSFVGLFESVLFASTYSALRKVTW